MRILSLDVGDKTIGVAMSDALLLTAQGIKTIRRTNIKKDTNEIIDIINNNEVSKVVIGYPISMDGRMSEQTEKTLAFKTKLENKIKSVLNKEIEIILWDERLTTVLAERTLISADVSRQKRKKVIDMIAATYILQSYLDSIK